MENEQNVVIVSLVEFLKMNLDGVKSFEVINDETDKVICCGALDKKGMIEKVEAEDIDTEYFVILGQEDKGYKMPMIPTDLFPKGSEQKVLNKENLSVRVIR